MNAIQVTHVTPPGQNTPATPVLSVLPAPLPYKVPPAPVYKQGSKWTVVAAFILSIALHVGAVALVEMDKPRVEFAENSTETTIRPF